MSFFFGVSHYFPFLETNSLFDFDLTLDKTRLFLYPRG